MTIEELRDNKDFVMGHKVRVKSVEEINKIEPEEAWTKSAPIKYAGQELISASIERENMKLYTTLTNNDCNDFDIKYLDFTSDDMKPSKEARDLAKQLVDSGLWFFVSTCGEMHGASVENAMTKENTYPVIGPGGEDLIHVPDCRRVHDTLSLSIIKELLDSRKRDASINTGMSYINRDYFLYTEEEAKKESFKY